MSIIFMAIALFIAIILLCIAAAFVVGVGSVLSWSNILLLVLLVLVVKKFIIYHRG